MGCFCAVCGVCIIPYFCGARGYAFSPASFAHVFHSLCSTTTPLPRRVRASLRRRRLAGSWLDAGAFAVGMGGNLVGEDVRVPPSEPAALEVRVPHAGR